MLRRRKQLPSRCPPENFTYKNSMVTRSFALFPRLRDRFILHGLILDLSKRLYQVRVTLLPGYVAELFIDHTITFERPPVLPAPLLRTEFIER